MTIIREKNGDRRDPHARRVDRRIQVGLVVGILCMALFALIGIAQLRRISHDERKRVIDLRGACLRTSVRSAAATNLDWLYYQSERRLAVPTRPIPPPQRASAQAAIAVLNARANADFNAAFANAHSVDFHQAKLIAARTVLGSGAEPREWVIRTHFDCSAVFR